MTDPNRSGTFLIINPDYQQPATGDRPPPSIATVDVQQVGAIGETVDGPRDVPRLRAALLNAWGDHQSIVTRDGRRGDSVDPAERRGLGDANLLWVSVDLTDTIDALRESCPGDTTLATTTAPWPSGFAVFARQLSGVDAHGNDGLTLHAMLWTPVNVILPGAPMNVPGPPAVGLSFYDLYDYTRGLNEAQLAAAAKSLALAVNEGHYDKFDALDVRGRSWQSLGRSDWLIGDPIDVTYDWLTDEQNRSAAEDRRLAYTLWHLMGEDQIVESSQVTRSKKAAKKRRQRPVDSPVTVLHLRRPRVDTGDVDTDGSGRRITVRHKVRPHWRQQAYGPGRTLRRPILIAPHWRGPEDGPVRVTETVWSLDR